MRSVSYSDFLYHYVIVDMLASSNFQQAQDVKSELSNKLEVKYIELWQNEIILFTMMHDGLPTAHKLTFLSSPPVTSTRPDLLPRDKQLTLAPWAVNSSVNKN